MNNTGNHFNLIIISNLQAYHANRRTKQMAKEPPTSRAVMNTEVLNLDRNNNNRRRGGACTLANKGKRC